MPIWAGNGSLVDERIVVMTQGFREMLVASDQSLGNGG
jgi:hypothetical protein